MPCEKGDDRWFISYYDIPKTLLEVDLDLCTLYWFKKNCLQETFTWDRTLQGLGLYKFWVEISVVILAWWPFCSLSGGHNFMINNPLTLSYVHIEWSVIPLWKALIKGLISFLIQRALRLWQINAHNFSFLLLHLIKHTLTDTQTRYSNLFKNLFKREGKLLFTACL